MEPDQQTISDIVTYFLMWCKTNGVTPMKHDGFNSYIPIEWASTAQERRLGAGEWDINRLVNYYMSED
jgi:hypothetical protein